MQITDSSKPDKFKALWVSHSSISDYIKCPRAYFLKNMYKDPVTGHKITLINPSLALGQVVHEVIDCLYKKKTEERFNDNLMSQFDVCWQKISGKLGGFKDLETEEEYKRRARLMVQSVIDDPGPLKNKAVRINQELPFCYLSEKENIILCGKIDWLEYNDDDSVNIIDFKTGKHEESPDSLQLPIYMILVNSCQRRKIKKIFYWYLDTESRLIEVDLPDLEESFQQVLHIAGEIKRARQTMMLKCLKGGCFYCKPYEAVVSGKGEFVGLDNYKRDIYCIFD